MDQGRSLVTWCMFSTGICACVFLATVFVHETAHGVVWMMLGAEGVAVKLGRVVVDGALPRGTRLESMSVLVAGPAVTLVQAAVAAVLIERHRFRRAATATVAAWTATAAAAYVAYALLTNRTGNDIGRLLRGIEAPAWASGVVAAVGIMLFVVVGLRCRCWFAHAAGGTGARGDAVPSTVAAIVAPWLLGVAVPFWLVVGNADGRHALGMGFFAVVALIFARSVEAAGAPTRRLAASWMAAGAAAWVVALAVDRVGGLPLG